MTLTHELSILWFKFYNNNLDMTWYDIVYAVWQSVTVFSLDVWAWLTRRFRQEWAVRPKLTVAWPVSRQWWGTITLLRPGVIRVGSSLGRMTATCCRMRSFFAVSGTTRTQPQEFVTFQHCLNASHVRWGWTSGQVSTVCCFQLVVFTLYTFLNFWIRIHDSWPMS